jgi:folylpolyglutamate synthase/dihydropteroate synthase
VKFEGLELVMDCAHNIGGINALISFLESTGAREIDLTFGVLEGKNWREMIKALSPYVRTWRLLLPDSERALPQELLRQELPSGTEVRVECYGSDYERCLREIASQAEGNKAFVTGSMYMVGRLRSMLSLPERPLWTRVVK